MTWPMVKLGDVVDIMGGGTPSKDTPEYWGGDIPWVSVKDFKSSFIDTASDYITTLGLEKSATNLIPSGTIVVPTRMAVGKVAVLGTHMAINQDLKALIIKNDEELDKRFLLRFLESRADHILKFAKGATVKGITLDVLKGLDVPLPLLEEQKRIAAILDKADAIRRKRQQAIKLADEFLRSVFLDMFGDPVTNPKGFPASKLGDLCEDLFLGLTSKVDYVDGGEGYPLVRAKDINTGELSFEEVKYISEDQHRKLTKNHLTRKGDLLVSKSGTLGTCAIVRTDREFSTYESIFTVRPDNSRLDLYYLIHLLQNKGFKEKLIGNKVGGTVAHLNLKMFRDFEIGVPPIALQHQFSKTISKIEAKLERYKVSFHEAEALFSSLSQKAFSGELNAA